MLYNIKIYAYVGADRAMASDVIPPSRSIFYWVLRKR